MQHWRAVAIELRFPAEIRPFSMLRCFCHDYLFVVGFTLMEEQEQSTALGSPFFSMIRAMSHEGSMFGSTCAKKISKLKTSHDSHVCSFVTRAVEQLELPFINAEVAKAFGLLPQLAAVPLGLCLSDDIVEDLLGSLVQPGFGGTSNSELEDTRNQCVQIAS